jgi:hypothetical protein
MNFSVDGNLRRNAQKFAAVFPGIVGNAFDRTLLVKQ